MCYTLNRGMISAHQLKPIIDHTNFSYCSLIIDFPEAK